jgi:Domain of unknown function (DUF4091)
MKYFKLLGLFFIICTGAKAFQKTDWEINVIPPSVRLDPVTNKIIEQRFNGVKDAVPQKNLLSTNWIYKDNRVKLHAARGEYVSFQLVITNNSAATLEEISIDLSSFKNSKTHLKIAPELFLEWSVEVKTPSTGYAKSSLGNGWYPDALIPLDLIQADSSKVTGRWTYPLWLPDFNNRVDNQKSLIVWVDQFIPFNESDATAGTYESAVAVTVGSETKRIPVDLTIWNFAIPNENFLKASLQQEGFLSSMDEKRELEVYQLFKRNRIALMDPNYQPVLGNTSANTLKINWNDFDKRLKKYFSGEAFTKAYGYPYGPGYGEPLEVFILPFDVYGKHGTPGWPDIGKPDVEKNKSNTEKYINAVKEVRSHLSSFVDQKKTDLFVYLNGLDESYFPEALDRMVYFGNLFKKNYPEAQFRVDGAYDPESMNKIGKSINAWASHTINYNIDEIKRYRKLGIKEWLYGPLLYEGKVNSWVGSSTFMDLPLICDRALSWSCWKYKTHSWLSWGAGFGWKSGWYDPETWKDAYKNGADSDPEYTFKKQNGNALLIYSPGIIPNVNKVCPSIRLKTMRNGVQEYEYMRLLTKLDQNSSRADKIVNDIIKEPFGEKSIGNLDVWSFDAERWDQKRIELGELINQSSQSK